MRFPSLVEVARTAGATFVRFPWVLLVAGVAATAAVRLISAGDEDALVRWLAASTLGLALLTALTVAGERWSSTRPSRALVPHLLPVAGVGVLALVYALWPSWSDPVAGRRYVQMSLCFHLLAAWLPYARIGEKNGFWQFNRVLFLRFLVGALYSQVLFVGLSMAIVALDQLFGLDVEEDTYFRLEALILFVFLTWFFLAGIPRDLRSLDADESYPRGLKVFSQFILSPIVVLYLLILTAYMVKIVVTQEWPSGWIGYLVSSVATVGILSLLLVDPIQERRENRWVKTYARSFYVVLFPSLIMLLLAVWKRVAQYGVTENRYFLVVLSLWLMSVSVYFVVSRRKSIKVIPITLCLVAFATTAGPWSAYAVARRSQVHRLESFLEANGMLQDGAVRSTTSDVSFYDRREISASLLYLIRTHGDRSVTGAFGWPELDDTPAARDDAAAPMTHARSLMERVGLEYVERHRSEVPRFFNLHTRPPITSVPISGYEHAVRVEHVPVDISIEGRALSVEIATSGDSLVVSETGGERLAISLAPLIDVVDARYAAGAEGSGTFEAPVLVHGAGDRLAVRARVWSVNGEHVDGRSQVRHLALDIYMRLGR